MNKIFNESYRPKEFEEVVGINSEIPKLIDSGNIPHMLFIGPAGSGKCVTDDSIINVNGVIQSFKEYKKKYKDNSDNILSDNNKTQTGIFVEEKTDKIIKILLEDGTILKGTPEHRIKCLDIEKGIVWKRLDEISEKDTTFISYDNNIFNKNNKKINFTYIKKAHDSSSINIKIPEFINKDIAYFLGCYIANGSINKNCLDISTHNLKLQSILKKIIKDNFEIDFKNYFDKRYNCNVGIRGNSVILISFLKSIGINGETARYKEVPLIIRESDKNIQLSFLKGLMDCDSHMDKSHTIEYSTSSENLSNHVRYMLLNMGIYSKIRYKYLKKYNHTYYRINIPKEFVKIYLGLINEYKFKKYNIEVKNTNISKIDNNFKLYIKNILKKYNLTKSGHIFLNGEYIRTPKKYSLLYSTELSSIERINEIMNTHSEIPEIENFLKYFKDNNLLCVKIKTKEILNQNIKVYDFHIPENHTFICNGLINHNTTVAKIIINKLNAESLILNASKDRGIDTIRDKIEPFAKKKSDKLKIVFLDEFDATTPAFQTALRNFMETYSSSTRFIATCNYPQKIIEPLHSRFSKYVFNKYTDEDKFQRLKYVIEKESIKIDDETILELIKKYKDDIRSMINFLEKNKLKDITKEDIISDTFTAQKILVQLANKKWFELRQELAKEMVDYENVLEQIDEIVFNHPKLTENTKIIINSIIAQGIFEMHFSFNKEITFAAILAKIQGCF